MVFETEFKVITPLGIAIFEVIEYTNLQEEGFKLLNISIEKVYAASPT